MPRAAAPAELRFEHRTDAGPVLGIGTARPRLSWVVPEADAAFAQDAYEVEVTRDGTGTPETVRVTSPEQVLVPWPAHPLSSRQSASVRVRVGGGGEWSEWSEPAVVEAGLLEQADWRARFVSPADRARAGGPAGASGLDEPAPVLGRVVDLPAGVVNGRLYATAHGVYVPSLNGRRVGDHVLTPGWTSYHHRLRYQTYDVTDLLVAGENRLEVLLGNGWYRGRLGFEGKRALYGDRLALLAQLEVLLDDGTVLVVATDEDWTAHDSGVLSDDLYDGQRTDLRPVGDTAAQVRGVETVPGDLARLVAPEGPPVRVTGQVPATRVLESPSGRTLVDFGQNVVGWVRLRVRGLGAGHEVTVRHAEVLEDGELGVRPLRTASATDTYLLSDGDDEVLEPSLTFHGFRYAEVTGAPDLRADDAVAVVVGSDLRRTGWFESSHPMLNRFHENVVWGMRGNFVDVPTDCPQRDERLGWTGDIQVFSPTASFLFDSAGFLSSWLADLAVEQRPNGSVPFVVPSVLDQADPAATAWGDAATLVPWVVYRHTGDSGLLARQLPSMRAWVDRVADLAGPERLWRGGFQFGDWLDPTAPPHNPFAAQADPDVVATAHLARSAEVVAQAARVVGDDALADRYETLAAETRLAFAQEYVTPGGRVLSDAPTVYALALQWALLPTSDQRVRAGRRLADLVRGAGFRISTGFVGTPLMTDALTSVGEVDLAYRLLLQTGCPSWLYPVTMGATTVWERWDSMLPDGAINPGEMTSFNHYALGAVADWLHRTVAGLAPAAPGYHEIEVRPRPFRDLTSASARHLTPYGPAEVAWRRADGRLLLAVEVPVGATATVHVPGDPAPHLVRHGRHEWDVADPSDDADPRAVLTSVREVMDDQTAWESVVAAAEESGAGGEAQVAGRLLAYLDRPVASLVDAVLPFARTSGREDLQRRLKPVLDRGS